MQGGGQLPGPPGCQDSPVRHSAAGSPAASAAAASCCSSAAPTTHQAALAAASTMSNTGPRRQQLQVSTCGGKREGADAPMRASHLPGCARPGGCAGAMPIDCSYQARQGPAAVQPAPVPAAPPPPPAAAGGRASGRAGGCRARTRPHLRQRRHQGQGDGQGGDADGIPAPGGRIGRGAEQARVLGLGGLPDIGRHGLQPRKCDGQHCGGAAHLQRGEAGWGSLSLWGSMQRSPMRPPLCNARRSHSHSLCDRRGAQACAAAP